MVRPGQLILELDCCIVAETNKGSILKSISHANWLAIGVVAFCLTAWGAGLFSVAKTAHLYANRSPQGFRHDVVEKARARWVQLKQVVATPTKSTGSGAPT
jgi:hypothetical protein